MKTTTPLMSFMCSFHNVKQQFHYMKCVHACNQCLMAFYFPTSCVE